MPHENKNIIHRQEESEKVYLEIGFQSDNHESALTKIELLGVPGVRLKNGELIVYEKDKNFLDDLIIKKIFSLSRRIEDCNYHYLKIWLWDNKLKLEEVPYILPSIDNNDLDILSKKQYSKLKRIYVLDNGLKGAEYRRWCHIAETLFTPLFDSFIAPPEAPSFLEDSLLQPFLKAIARVNESLDTYAMMKEKMFFNALIIQID